MPPTETPRTPTARHLLTTNKDAYSAIPEACLPRNLTVRESELLDIEAELIVELEKEGWVLIPGPLYEALLQWFRVQSVSNGDVLFGEVGRHLREQDA